MAYVIRKLPKKGSCKRSFFYFPLPFAEKSDIIFLMINERKSAMIFDIATMIPDTGNVSANTYMIVLIAAGVLIIGAVLAGIFTKKKKK